MRRGDVEGLLADCDPALEFVSLVGQVEGGDSYVGHDGLRRFFSDLREAWDVWIPQPDQFESVGDTVLVTGTTQFRGKGSGAELTQKWGQVFRLRDGKVVWSKIYSDRQEARREAGLDK
jgi:ketosteroid isomerase-like protein